MKEEYQRNCILARGKEVFIGIDVHKESWQVTVRTEGEEIFNGRLPSHYHALEQIIARFPKSKIKVAYEAGPCGFWLYEVQQKSTTPQKCAGNRHSDCT
jgi:hypothetical protein